MISGLDSLAGSTSSDSRTTASKAGAAPTYGFEEFRANNYFGALDGLRALSILMVLLHHVPEFPPGFVRTFQLNGRYGVSFFFVVSGFLICTLLLRERQRTGKIAWGKFYARRALRLLPLYYATLALQCVLVFALKIYSPENQELFRAKLPAYVFYFSNWLSTATQGPFFYAWSLAVEEQFYVGFGLLLWLMSRRRIVGLFLAALAAKFIAFQVFGTIDAQSTMWRVLFSYQEAILWGVLLAFALNNRAWYGWTARTFGSGLVLGALALGLTVMLWLHPMEAQSTWDAQLLYLGMMLVVASIVVRRRTPILTTPLLLHIGKISYGIYLLHTLVIYAAKRLPAGNDPLLSFLISTPLSVAFASLVYVCFEHPIIAYYKSRLSPLIKADNAPYLHTPPFGHPSREGNQSVSFECEDALEPERCSPVPRVYGPAPETK